MAQEDLTRPTKEDMAAIMAELRQAVESDPTLERRWMLQMAKYIFWVVGDYQEKVETDFREVLERMDRCEQCTWGIHQELSDRVRKNEREANIVLSLGEYMMKVLKLRDGEQNATTPRSPGPDGAKG